MTMVSLPTNSPGVTVVSNVADVGVTMPSLTSLVPSMMASPHMDATSRSSHESLYDAASILNEKEEKQARPTVRQTMLRNNITN
jgi:hypothetical protein